MGEHDDEVDVAWRRWLLFERAVLLPLCSIGFAGAAWFGVTQAVSEGGVPIFWSCLAIANLEAINRIYWTQRREGVWS